MRSDLNTILQLKHYSNVSKVFWSPANVSSSIQSGPAIFRIKQNRKSLVKNLVLWKMYNKMKNRQK